MAHKWSRLLIEILCLKYCTKIVAPFPAALASRSESLLAFQDSSTVAARKLDSRPVDRALGDRASGYRQKVVANVTNMTCGAAPTLGIFALYFKK